MLFGATGYALQGTPGLPASPAKPQSTQLDVAPDIIELRGAFFGRYTGDAAYQTAADAMIRISDPASAVRVTLGGIDRNPKSAALWTELGTVLVTHDAGNVSPAALFAFRHAMQLAPRHPGPPFFLGLAMHNRASCRMPGSGGPARSNCRRRARAIAPRFRSG